MKRKAADKIDELFSRATEKFVDPDDFFVKKLRAFAEGESTERPIVKFGADPTRPDIHLGHAVVLRKLRAMQDLGAKIIFLVGDFTALIGDPTGKSKVRPELSTAEIEANMQTYLEQISKILKTDDPETFTWTKNSDWFLSLADLVAPTQTISATPDQPQKGVKNLKINFPANSYLAKAVLYQNSRRQSPKNIHQVTMREFMQVLRGITHAQLIQRDMFQDRIAAGDELYLHEMMYPVLQGIDSLMIRRIFGACDLEIGGTDQLFNNLMGRTVMKNAGVAPQSVAAFSLLEGLDGKEKMSKSLDNYIGVTDESRDMYGKVMSLPDKLIGRWFELTTFTPEAEVISIKEQLDVEQLNPYEAKKRLAREIVAIYHGEAAADQASQAFTSTFSRGEIPDDLTEVSLETGETLGEALVRLKIVPSKTQWRRLVEQSSVTDLATDEKVTDEKITPAAGEAFRVGKKRFVKIV